MPMKLGEQITYMESITLSTYWVKVREKYRENLLRLDKFDGTTDLLDHIESVLKNLKGRALAVDETALDAISVDRLERSHRSVYGFILTGRYGKMARITDTKTKEVVFTQLRQHVNLVPLYYHFYLPAGMESGVLVMQRGSNFGAKSQLEEYLYNTWSPFKDKYLLRFGAMAPAQLFQEVLEKGHVTKIRFLKHELTTDLVDQLDVEDGERDATMELVVHAKRGKPLRVGGLIDRWLNANAAVQDFVDIRDTRFT